MSETGCFVVVIDFVNRYGQRIPIFVNEDDVPVMFSTRDAAEKYAKDVPLCRMFNWFVLDMANEEVV